jgi:soluble lytic murein transglycosylase-like protein
VPESITEWKGFDLPARHVVASGVLAILASATLARAESNHAGGTVYPTPARTEPASATAAPSQPSIQPTRHIVSRRFARRHGWAAKVAAEPVEGPAPTASASATPPQTTVVEQAGPHEGPAPAIGDLIAKHARENGVPTELANAVVRIESRFNPRARGGSAIGLMQIKVGTARSMGFDGGAASLYQPETNLHFGMKVLADAYRASHGDICMTLARYQSGHRTTRLSAANRSYCARARSFMAKL